MVKGGARRKARRGALELLFEAHARQVDPEALLAERLESPVDESPVRPYAQEIVRGVAARQDRIDELLATYSTGWTLDRMPKVDRELLRIGAWETLYNPAVPASVAIDEAVALAVELSTDSSPSFVNGLLGRIASLAPNLAD